MITFEQLMERRVGRQEMSPTADDPLKQAVRAPGDVGKVERLQQMDKNKSKMTRVADTAQRMASSGPLQAKADEVLRDLGATGIDKVGSVRTPRDYRDPAQFSRRIAQIGRKMNNVQSDRGMVDDPTETEIDPKYDRDAATAAVENPGAPPVGWSPDSKDKAHKEYTAKLKAFHDAQNDPNTYQGGSDPEELLGRMARADLAGRDMVSAADTNFDDAIAGAQGPTLRQPSEIETPGGTITQKDSPELRHGYLASGVGVMNKKELDTEYIDALVGGILDPDLSSSSKDDALLGIRDDLKSKKTPAVQQKKDGDFDLEIKDPTRRDIEAMSDDGETVGELQDRAYLTPEVKQKQKDMRDALKGQQSDKVQELSFKFKDVSDDLLDDFIERFGAARGQRGKDGKARLIADIEARGGVDGERSIIWGGDIKVPAAARKDNDGNPLPKGQVNMSKIDDNNLKGEIKAQRARELVRTYLKQGGINAYAQHEGFRSMLDMDLEHIKSLKAGGYDSPDNWVWASSDLNQLRGDQDLGPFVDKRVTDTGITGPDDGSKLGGTTQQAKRKDIVQTFSSFTKDNPENKKALDAFTDEFGDPSAARIEKRGMFAPNEYAKLSQDEIEEYKASAKKYFRFTDDMINTIFSDQGRLRGLPLGDGESEDYEALDQDSTTNIRDQVRYRDSRDKIEKANPNMPKAVAKRLALDNLKKLGPSDVGMKSQQDEEDFSIDI